MARRQEAIDATRRQRPGLGPIREGVGQDRLHRRHHAHVGGQDREVGDRQGPRLPGQQGGSRRGGFKPHRQKHHLPLGVGAGQGDRLLGRREQLHVPPGGPHPQQVVAGQAAGNAQHVAVGGQDHLGPARQGQGRIDGGCGGDAHRTAGAMEQLQAGRQQLIEAPAHDRVGLAAAHLHHGPGAGGDRRQLSRQRRHLRRTARRRATPRRAHHGPGAKGASAAG